MSALSIDQRLRRLEARAGGLARWGVRAAIELGPLTAEADADLEVPDAWPLEETWLDIDPGAEGLLTIDYPGGARQTFGCDANHRRVPLRERRASCRLETGVRLSAGARPLDPPLHAARLLWVDVAIERLERQLRLVVEVARAVGDHPVVEPLVAGGEQAVRSLRWPSATAAYMDPGPRGLSDVERATVLAASLRLESTLQRLRSEHPPLGTVALVGHAHIDVAWLWTIAETRRKVRRTFHSVLGLLERYPEFTFNQSSAQLYSFAEKDDPVLFGQVQAAVEAGGWEPIGGMWVEADATMTSGESLCRQLLYGQRYFQGRFGGHHRVAWLPDCFGFTPALPQLLRGAGIDHFLTVKLTWSETNDFPYDLFWWEGLDGSRVLAHSFRNALSYNSEPTPSRVLETWANYGGKHAHPETLLSVGFGDGGGGPTAEMLESARELASFPVVPRLRWSSVDGFFDRVDSSAPLPTWVGELYLELHRGTFTTQGRIKRLMRRVERDLVAAEVLAGMLSLHGAPETASAEELWRVVLRNQFHDILPGTSIREVCSAAEAELARVVDEAEALIRRRLDELIALAPAGDRTAVLVVNPDLSPRPLRAELTAAVPGAQRVDGGWAITGDVSVPALGARVITGTEPCGDLEVTEHLLENDVLRVVLGEDGALISVLDKLAQREVLAGRGNQLWAHADRPRDWDAWEIEEDDAQTGEELPAPDSIEVTERGPHRAAVRVRRRFRDSTVTQSIRLWAGSARLEFLTTLDWHDRHWLVKARFPLAVRSDHALFETAFGVVSRPTHRNTSWDAARFEVSGHRFALLAEPGYGVALLNDGRYGHHVLGNELGLSLLRSPTYPDPLADEGLQTVTYALLPYQGEWRQAGVLTEAEDLNRPLLTRPCRAGEEVSWSSLTVAGAGLGLGTLKPLENGAGLVLRAYEPYGARGAARIELPAGWVMDAELDLLERPLGEPQTFFTPFQVHTWRLRRSAGWTAR